MILRNSALCVMALITLLGALTIPVRAVSGPGEDLRTTALRGLPPIRLFIRADGWVFDEQVRLAKPALWEKLRAAEIPLTVQDEWPPRDDYGLALQIEGRINTSGGGCVLAVTTNLIEDGHRIRKLQGVDNTKVDRVISWHGTPLIGYSPIGQHECWRLFVKLAAEGIDEFVEAYRVANAKQELSPGFADDEANGALP